jgi:hypothetical protein
MYGMTNKIIKQVEIKGHRVSKFDMLRCSMVQ